MGCLVEEGQFLASRSSVPLCCAMSTLKHYLSLRNPVFLLAST